MTESILMLVLMFAVMYIMLIRPENKRKKANDEMRNNLKKGDVVTTIGGIVGTIVQTGRSTVIIETSEDRVRVEVTRWGISSVGVQTGEQPETPKKEKKKDLSDESVEFADPVDKTDTTIALDDIVINAPDSEEK